MGDVRIFQVDAFTAQPYCGNPAGVVLDAQALTDQQMQALARELNNGDTAFVLPSDADDHDLRVRFFTPKREAAFVGHATLAVHAVQASLGLPPLRRQKQKTGIVEIDTLNSDPPRIAIHVAPPPTPRALPSGALEEILSALGLTAAAMDPQCPVVIAGDSGARVLLAVSQSGALDALQPDMVRLTALSEQLKAPGFFVFTRRPRQADTATEARMFAPALGIAEDPVSGNAHALLGAYLLQHGLLEHRSVPQAPGSVQFTGAQGHHMGRPGRVGVALTLDGTTLESVSIIGEATIIFEARLARPPHSL